MRKNLFLSFMSLAGRLPTASLAAAKRVPRRCAPFLALIGLSATLAACGGAPPPPEHFYRLTEPQLEKQAQPLAGRLIVERLRTDGVTGERPIAYSKAGQEKNLAAYRYHLWAEAPGRMMQLLLARALKDANVAKDVMTDEARVEGDWIVKGRLAHFEQVLGGSPKALLEAELTVVATKNYEPILHAVYREEETAAGESPAAFADAMQTAIDRLCRRLAQDLKAK